MKPDTTESTRPFPSVEAAFNYLENFTNFEKRSGEPGEYRLDRMAALLEICGNPQDACPAIHIAGSKGKGSTAQFCGAILRQAGYKVGIYASPHLIDYRERIGSAEGYFSDQCYILCISQVRKLVDDLAVRDSWKFGEPSTFELLTLTAYLAFKKENVQWMVIETGLGGRLDATNLMQSRACLITALELEHMDVLGNTIEEISREKAGIFRKDALLLTQEQDQSAMSVLLSAAQALRTELHYPVPIQIREQTADLSTLFFEIPLRLKKVDLNALVHLSAKGNFQHRNAEIAARCVAYLWDEGQLAEIPNLESLRASIQSGLASTSIPGRLQSFHRVRNGKNQIVFLDGAHTPRSVKLVGEYFKATAADSLLFGCVSGKLHAEMAAILTPGFGQIIISTPGTFKKSEPETVFASFNKHGGGRCRLEIEPDRALQSVLEWLESHHRGRGLVCGSFYMAGIILPYLLAAGFKPEEQKSPCP